VQSKPDASPRAKKNHVEIRAGYYPEKGGGSRLKWELRVPTKGPDLEQWPQLQIKNASEKGEERRDTRFRYPA